MSIAENEKQFVLQSGTVSWSLARRPPSEGRRRSLYYVED